MRYSRRQILLGAAAAGLAGAAGANGIVQVSGAEGLAAALASARDGDRIVLAPGRYGAVRLQNRRFAQPVTITSADPASRAVLTDRLILSGVEGLVVEGIDITAGALAPRSNTARTNLSGCRDVTLRDITVTGHIPTASEGLAPLDPAARRRLAIAGYGYDIGLHIGDSRDIRVERVTLRDLRVGIALSRSETLRLSGLDLGALREGINMHDVSDVEIAASRFHDFLPWKPGNGKDDHPDMIQYWGTNGVSGVHNLTIRDNLFYQPPDLPHTQTIYGSMRFAPDASVTATNFTVTGNTIVNGHLNAIGLYDVQGALIADNLLLPTARGGEDLRTVTTPSIVLPGARDVTIARNRFLPLRPNDASVTIKADAEALDGGSIRFIDNVFLSRSRGSPLFWRRFLPAGHPGRVGP